MKVTRSSRWFFPVLARDLRATLGFAARRSRASSEPAVWPEGAGSLLNSGVRPGTDRRSTGRDHNATGEKQDES